MRRSCWISKGIGGSFEIFAPRACRSWSLIDVRTSTVEGRGELARPGGSEKGLGGESGAAEDEDDADACEAFESCRSSRCLDGAEGKGMLCSAGGISIRRDGVAEKKNAVESGST